MSRSALIAIRYVAVAVAIVFSGVYTGFVAPLDNNIIDLRLCLLTAIGAYLTMTSSLLVLPRIRKTDLGIFCWIVLALGMLGQLLFAFVHQAPVPHLSQALSGMAGVLAAILPMYVVDVRRQSREDRQMARWVQARKMVSGTI